MTLDDVLYPNLVVVNKGTNREAFGTFYKEGSDYLFNTDSIQWKGRIRSDLAYEYTWCLNVDPNNWISYSSIHSIEIVGNLSCTDAKSSELKDSNISDKSMKYKKFNLQELPAQTKLSNHLEVLPVIKFALV